MFGERAIGRISIATSLLKTKDWKYEQEYRLILRSRWSKLDEKKNRTRTYNFNSLKGIIFGIQDLR